MTSNKPHPSYISSSTDITRLERKQLERSTTEEFSIADDIDGWKSGLLNDNEVPTLLQEHELVELGFYKSNLFSDDENLDIPDLNDAFPGQVLAAGSLVFPEDDTPLEESAVATQDSQKGRLSRKRRYALMKFEKVEKNALVGPDSEQMKVITRIIDYLNETVGEDPELLPRVRAIVEKCKKRHEDRENKYRHLPGAIFEALVDTIGGPTFHRLFTKSKEYQDSRVYIKKEEEKDDARQVALPDAPTSRSIGVKTSPTPTLLLTGIAYGFHKARTSSRADEKAVEKVMQECECVVSHMNEEERNAFWEHFFHCDCLADKAL